MIMEDAGRQCKYGVMDVDLQSKFMVRDSLANVISVY